MSPNLVEEDKTLTRRNFLTGVSALVGSAAIAEVGLAELLAEKTHPPRRVTSKVVKVRLPVIISTWPQGLAATKIAGELLIAGKSGLDAVEKGINTAEDDPKVQSVGLGGLPDENGIVTLDASIMDGPRRTGGAVGGLENIRNAISVARKVLEDTDHVLLVGDGAKQFAIACGFKEENLLTEESRKAWLEWKKSGQKGFWGRPPDQFGHDTIGLILCDANHNLYGGVSTSGLSWKIHGRVGDSPILGAGLFVDNDVGAACATGRGEEVIKVCGSFLIVELMRQGHSPQEACEEALRRIRRNNPKRTDFAEAFLAVNKDGETGAAYFGKEFTYAIFAPDVHEMRSGEKWEH